MATAKWNVRTIAADEDRELFNAVWKVIRDIDGSKPNNGYCGDDAWLFTPNQQRDLYRAAVRYACVYRGNFEFMISMRERTLKSLPSEGQMWSILNCMKADFRRRCEEKRATEKATTVVADVPPAVSQSVVPNGFYTINMGDNTHVTIKLDDDFRSDVPKGSQIASFLCGSDNTSAYKGFAFVGPPVRVWRSAGEVSRQRAALDILLGADTEAAANYGMAYAIESGRCARCNRLLTVEASISKGLGPECARKRGM